MLYVRLPRLLQELPMAKAMAGTANSWRVGHRPLWSSSTIGAWRCCDEHRRDLLAVLEDRHGRRATLVTSQLPLEHWHEALGDPTLADAILDRLVHNAYKITLTGDSRRKRLAASKTGALQASRCPSRCGEAAEHVAPTWRQQEGAHRDATTTSGSNRSRVGRLAPHIVTCAITSRTKSHAPEKNERHKATTMLQHDEQRRRQAVARYLAGDKVEDICQQMGCSKSWLYKWKTRYRAADPSWARERARRPKTLAAKNPLASHTPLSSCGTP